VPTYFTSSFCFVQSSALARKWQPSRDYSYTSRKSDTSKTAATESATFSLVISFSYSYYHPAIHELDLLPGLCQVSAFVERYVNPIVGKAYYSLTSSVKMRWMSLNSHKWRVWVAYTRSWFYYQVPMKMILSRLMVFSIERVAVKLHSNRLHWSVESIHQGCSDYIRRFFDQFVKAMPEKRQFCRSWSVSWKRIPTRTRCQGQVFDRRLFSSRSFIRRSSINKEILSLFEIRKVRALPGFWIQHLPGSIPHIAAHRIWLWSCEIFAWQGERKPISFWER